MKVNVMMNEATYKARVEELKLRGLTPHDAEVLTRTEKAKLEGTLPSYPPENRFENMPDAELEADILEKATGKKHHAYRSKHAHAPFVAAPIEVVA